MLTKFQNHIEQNFHQLKDKKLFLAVSGGIDSMVLLDLFYKLRFDICVVHCNFQLRGEESDADELFVKVKSKKFLTISKDFVTACVHLWTKTRFPVFWIQMCVHPPFPPWHRLTFYL